MKHYWPILVTVIAWSVGPVLVRGSLDRGFSPLTSTLAGTALAVPIFLVMLRRAGALERPRGSRPVTEMVAGGFLGVGGTMFSYLAIGTVPIAVAISVSNTHPLFTAIFSRLVSGEESLTTKSWGGVAFIVLGLALVSAGGI